MAPSKLQSSPVVLPSSQQVRADRHTAGRLRAAASTRSTTRRKERATALSDIDRRTSLNIQLQQQ